MTAYIEIYADSAHGIYIPQYFAESCNRELVQGVSDEDWQILETGPDHEFYSEAWETVLNNAVITDSRGKWYLYQDGDLFITHENYLHEDAKDSLVKAINEYAETQREYEETHVDAGDSYSHLPRESWSNSDNDNLSQFMHDNQIDDCGLDIDTIAEIVLDNFTMRSGHIYSNGNDDSFTCGAYPIQEIEIQIDYDDLTSACCFEVTRAHIEQLENATDSFIGSINDDSCLAYESSDSVWIAEISANKLQRLIRESSHA